MLAIKGVMKEELENAKKAYGAYKKAINKLLVGVLVKKEIKGRDYYYLVFRKGKKVKFIYKGKNVSQEEIEKYADAKRMRAKYIHYRADLKKQISFYKKALNIKEIRAANKALW